MTTFDRYPRLPAPLLPAGRRNGWTLLDPAWANALGVPRDGGRYRIRSSELLRRMQPAPEPLAVPGIWEIDPARSRISLSGPGTDGVAAFGPVSGTLTAGRDSSGIRVDLAAGHGAAGEAPVRFRSRRLQQRSPRSARLYGELTFGGVTREASMELSYLGPSPDGSTVVALTGSTRIDTRDFGLQRRSGDDPMVQLSIDARAVAAA